MLIHTVFPLFSFKDLQIWKLTDDGQLLNKALGKDWVFGDKMWLFEPLHTKTIHGLFVVQRNISDGKYLNNYRFVVIN